MKDEEDNEEDDEEEEEDELEIEAETGPPLLTPLQNDDGGSNMSLAVGHED